MTQMLNNELDDAKRYWNEVLESESGAVKLYYDSYAILEPDENRIWTSILGANETKQLLQLAKNESLLIYTVFVSFINIFLHKYSGNETVSILSPVYGEELNPEGLLEVKVQTEDHMSVRQLLGVVRNQIIGAYKFQHYYKELQLTAKGDSPRVAVVYNRLHKKEQWEKLIGSPELDLILQLEQDGDNLSLSIYYSSLFNASTIKQYGKTIEHIAEQALSSPSTSLLDIRMITDGEQNDLLEEWKEQSEESGVTLKERFEEQVRIRPQSSALDIEGTVLSYEELNRISNIVAEELLKRNIRTGSITGIMMDYSIEMIASIIGTLKAGGAYLPIDPTYPRDRIEYILEDSQPDLLLVDEHSNSTLQHGQGSVLESLNVTELLNGNDAWCPNPDTRMTPDDVAYMIYTSGSTGKPKGVPIKHKGIVNFVDWRKEAYQLTYDDRILQLISFSFDGFGANLYSSLLLGGTLVLPHRNNWRDFVYIANHIFDWKITNLSVVPSMLQHMLDNSQPEHWMSVRSIILAGERATAPLLQLCKEKIPSAALINEYGPTENSITTTSFMNITPRTASVIGRPVAHHKIIMLDQNNHCVPVGFPGEICVSGVGLSPGYWNNMGLTQSKFIQDPWKETRILYKTGDLGRLLEDGNIEMLGRIDNQVKIRGNRIELGEIEQSIIQIPMVQEAVVVDAEDPYGNVLLYAYIRTSSPVIEDELNEILSRYLPDYMVPSKYIVMDQLPLTPNGKINRNALRTLCGSFSATPLIGGDVTTSLEAEIRLIWETVLGSNQWGVRDNFFHIGGNSILLMQVHAHIEKQYPNLISIPDLFAYPTIEKLAGHLEQLLKKKDFRQYYPVLGEAYLCQSFSKGYEEGRFECEIEGDTYDTLEKAREMAGVRAEHILLSAFTSLLAKLSKQTEISVLTSMNEDGEWLPCTFNLLEIGDFTEFFTQAKEKLEKQTGLVSLAACSTPDINSHSIIPLYSTTNQTRRRENETLQQCLMLQAIVKHNSCHIVFTFNKNHVSEEKMKVVLHKYEPVLCYACSQLLGKE